MQRHDTQPCGHPVCFTDQWTHSLLSSPVPVTQTGYTTPYTHMHTHTSHTVKHSSHTPQTHTVFTPSLTHSIHTHTHSFTYTHPHTFLTYSQTYSSYPYKHTPSQCSLPSHTHTKVQSLQEHRHRKHGDPAAMLTHQAHGVCGNSPESQLRSVAGPSTHWEPLGLLEAP